MVPGRAIASHDCSGRAGKRGATCTTETRPVVVASPPLSIRSSPAPLNPISMPAPVVSDEPAPDTVRPPSVFQPASNGHASRRAQCAARADDDLSRRIVGKADRGEVIGMQGPVGDSQLRRNDSSGFDRQAELASLGQGVCVTAQVQCHVASGLRQGPIRDRGSEVHGIGVVEIEIRGVRAAGGPTGLQLRGVKTSAGWANPIEGLAVSWNDPRRATPQYPTTSTNADDQSDSIHGQLLKVGAKRRQSTTAEWNPPA